VSRIDLRGAAAGVVILWLYCTSQSWWVRKAYLHVNDIQSHSGRRRAVGLSCGQRQPTSRAKNLKSKQRQSC